MTDNDWHSRNLAPPPPDDGEPKLNDYMYLTPKGPKGFKPAKKDGSWWIGVIVLGLALAIPKIIGLY